jgi:Ca-activated chloride channel homolog
MNRRSAGLFRVEKWNPDAPYLAALENAMPDHRYAFYLQERKTYGRSPGFYLECADFFYEHGDPKLALQVLTNLAELDLENAPLLRLLGHRLRQWDRLGESVEVFEEVLRLRPEDPHAYRDLALVLADRAETRLARDANHPGGREDLARAIALLHTVSVTPWDRLQEIELTATLELNRLLAVADRRGIPHMDVDARFLAPMDLDLRVVMSWDTDRVDLDLWVTEPSGEKVRYSHKESAMGGLLSRDMMNGYGPEEYLLRRAVPGSYLIEANFYLNSALSLTGPVTVRVDIFFDYGRPKERRKTFTAKLRGREDTCRIAEVCRAARNREPLAGSGAPA